MDGDGDGWMDVIFLCADPRVWICSVEFGVCNAELLVIAAPRIVQMPVVREIRRTGFSVFRRWMGIHFTKFWGCNMMQLF